MYDLLSKNFHLIQQEVNLKFWFMGHVTEGAIMRISDSNVLLVRARVLRYCSDEEFSIESIEGRG